LAPLAERLIEDFYLRTGDVFKSRGKSHGFPWDENSPRYAAIKKKHYGHVRLLELSGDLLGSLTSSGAPGSVKDITADGFAVGTSLPYASKHQDGSSERFDIPDPFNMTINGVPARPMVSFLDADRKRWEDHAMQWLAEMAAKVAS
jgi:phage gpG-like protein